MDTLNLPQVLNDLERSYILVALERCDGNISRAAALLGLKRTTLRAKIHVNGIQEPKARVVPLVDPHGDFSIERVKTLVAVMWQDEVLKKFRTITQANAFLQEKMDE